MQSSETTPIATTFSEPSEQSFVEPIEADINARSTESEVRTEDEWVQILREAGVIYRPSTLQTVGERIEGHTEETFEFKKFRDDTHKGDPTGMVLLTNRVRHLTVIDIDMDKSQTKRSREIVSNMILESLPEDSVVVKSASGGLHIYCNTGDHEAPKNRDCDACEQTPYGKAIKGIDLIGSVDMFSRSGIMFAGSRVMTPESGLDELVYEFVRGGLDSVIKHNVDDILERLNFKLKPSEERSKVSSYECTDEKMDCNDEFAKAIIGGLSGFKVHGLGSKKLEDAVCLFTLCKAINALPEEFINDAYDHVTDHCKFTDNGHEHFGAAVQRYVNQSSPGVILKLLRIHNPVYYRKTIAPLIAASYAGQNDESNDPFIDAFDGIIDESVDTSVGTPVDTSVGTPVTDAPSALPQTIGEGIIDPRRRKPKTAARKTSTKQPMSDELAQAFVDGLTGIPIVGYSKKSMDDEVSLFNVFSAVYSLPDAFISKALENVTSKCHLMKPAKSKYLDELEKFKRKNGSTGVSSYGCLVKLIKVWNPDHFDDVVSPILERENENKVLIDDVKDREEELKAWDFNILTDGFTKAELYEKAPYGSIADVIIDLKRIMIEVTEGTTMYIYKFPGKTETTGRIVFKTFNEMVTELGPFPIGKTSNRANAKELTAWDIYKKYSKYFRLKRLAFNTNEPRSYNIFRGLPYTPTQTLDREMIKPYLDHIHDIIADNNEADYDHLIKWIASIIQKPGFKTALAPVLVGAQGTGKGMFTDIISDLIGCYAWRNAERACDVTGKNNGNLENKMFVVLNEARDANSKRCLEGDLMKSLITEDSMNIEDKYVKSHNAENVLNFIMCTNNYHPIEMDETDRRYMPLKVSSARIGDTAYFDRLVELRKHNEFYENLMRFFLDVDLTGYNSRTPPSSSFKDEMKQAGWTTVDRFVREEFMTIYTSRVDVKLHTMYSKWCADNGLTDEKLKIQSFENEIYSKYIERKNIKTKRTGDSNSRAHYDFKFGVEPKLREWYDKRRDECEDFVDSNDDINDRV